MMAPAMSQQGVTFQQVTVSEAAGILGVSTQTVRRLLRRGQRESERETTIRVRLWLPR
jgi:DNA-directed RNA polymerase specialized sigma24 family protein